MSVRKEMVIRIVWWLCLVVGALCEGIPVPNNNAVLTSKDQMPLDENGKLATNLFVYPEKCAAQVELAIPAVESHTLYAVAGDLEQSFFGHLEDKDNCHVACVRVGLDQKVMTSPLPHLFSEAFPNDNSADGTKTVKDFFWHTCRKVEFGFVNYNENPVQMSWVDPTTGERNVQNELEYGEKHTKFITTFIGHTFVFSDTKTGEDVSSYTIQFDGIFPIGESGNYTGADKDWRRIIERTANSEWRRHGVIKRSFSALGFKKGRLPDDVWGSIGAYYYNNRNHRSKEEWSSKGAFVNWFDVDVYFIQIPWDLKRVWQDRLKLLVEEWTGVELENTDIYGMRQYEKGARLLTHVDRESTHAASLIINVEQMGVETAWPVEVHDHANRLHEVVMEPGDIVYYESAKCLHGRNRPLASGSYINLFTHYRPKGDPQWFLKENPPGTPEPLLDVGDCRLVGQFDQFSQGAVQCDNPAIGPHLSPTMFTATSGESLFQWWESVGPLEHDHDEEDESDDEEEEAAHEDDSDDEEEEPGHGGDL